MLPGCRPEKDMLKLICKTELGLHTPSSPCPVSALACYHCCDMGIHGTGKLLILHKRHMTMNAKRSNAGLASAQGLC